MQDTGGPEGQQSFSIAFASALTDGLGEEHYEGRPEDANELPLQTFSSWGAPRSALLQLQSRDDPLVAELLPQLGGETGEDDRCVGLPTGEDGEEEGDDLYDGEDDEACSPAPANGGKGADGRPAESS